MSDELHDMIAEKRRLEAIALAADNAVLRQSIAIWERYKIYCDCKSSKEELLETPKRKSQADCVRSVFNGEALLPKDVLAKVTVAFPNRPWTMVGIRSVLQHLTKPHRQELVITGERKYRKP